MLQMIFLTKYQKVQMFMKCMIDDVGKPTVTGLNNGYKVIDRILKHVPNVELLLSYL